jgi:hypothetical protein
MKTTKILFSVLLVAFLGATTTVNAQATTASISNTVTATAYLGSGSSSNFDVLFKRNAISAGRLATTYTTFGVNTPLTGLPSSVLIGANAGQFSSGTGFNTFIGQNAGKGQSAGTVNSGTYNTYLGYNSGQKTTTGSGNFIGGDNAGFDLTTASANIILGSYASAGLVSGSANISIGGSSTLGADASYCVVVGNSAISGGSYNVSMGYAAGNSGSNNTCLGIYSGFGGSGDNNVFLGSEAGYGQTLSNKLIIDNSSTENSLIWGDFSADQLKFNGKVGIGGNSTSGFGNYPNASGTVDVSGYKLFVKGGILAHEVRVSTTWADYVFNKDYNLKPLSEVEMFIKDNGHLPNVPSAAQVEEEGIELGNMAKIQQEKIEELTLYIIEQNKQLESQNKRIEKLESILLGGK